MADAEPAVRRAANVVFATGYYDHPNRLDVPGEDLPHVAHYYTEAHGYYRKQVVVVGGKNSAAIAALELYRAGAHVTLVHRRRAAQRLHQVLDPPGHREPHQGGLDPGPLRDLRDRDPRAARSC